MTSVAGEDGHPGRADDDSDPDASRVVYVPPRMYKAITVFSTIFAIFGFVLGFVLLDRATDRARVDLADADPALALVGLACILLGSAIYWFSTRFQVEEMGKPKDETDEGVTDG